MQHVAAFPLNSAGRGIEAVGAHPVPRRGLVEVNGSLLAAILSAENMVHARSGEISPVVERIPTRRNARPSKKPELMHFASSETDSRPAHVFEMNRSR